MKLVLSRVQCQRHLQNDTSCLLLAWTVDISMQRISALNEVSCIAALFDMQPNAHI
jgi:hypothetical protein